MPINQLATSVKTVLFTIFISFNLSLHANHFTQSESYLNHLSEVNKEWLHHKDACPKTMISFHSDIDRIQQHLNLVIEHLTLNRSSSLNTEQLSNRIFLLQGLQYYTDQKVFPINTRHSTRQPYFVDDIGTNCAVGQMIYLSGYEQLVNRISEEHNYDYIEDIKTRGLNEWAIKFGFTIEELKWIQPGYLPTETMEQVLDGTNGNVKTINYNGYNGSLTIAGNFTELNNIPCLNIGEYKDNQLSCLGAGISGVINEVISQTGNIYAFGELEHNGIIFPVAKYDGNSWSYLSIPNRDNAISTSANFGGSGYQFELAISHNSIPNHQEIWHLLNDNTWRKKVKLKGFVLDILASSYGRVHVGHFDSVTVYNSNSIIDTTFIANNVLFNTNNTSIWYGIGNNISDTVNVVKSIGNALIFGGTCSNQPGVSNVCISRYFNSVLQPLYTNNSVTDTYSVNAITYQNGDEFTFGGDFDIQPMLGTYGSHLARYNIVSNTVYPIALLDEPVHSLSFFNNDLYIGGSFQTNLNIHDISYLGRIRSNVELNKSISTININVYPNPFNTLLNLKGVKNGANYSILSSDGRILTSGKVMNQKINNLDVLPKGIYLLELETTNGNSVTKIYK